MQQKTKQYLILGVLLLVLWYFSVNLHSFYSFAGAPLNIINVLPSDSPFTSVECRNLGGKCIPVAQPNIMGTLEYGSCGLESKCVFEDLCLKTGGKYNFKLVKLEEKAVFEKSCVCPVPLEFSIKDGCFQRFT